MHTYVLCGVLESVNKCVFMVGGSARSYKCVRGVRYECVWYVEVLGV